VSVQHATESAILAVDLGGTQIRAAYLTPGRDVHHRRATETRDEEGVDAVLARIVDVATASLEAAQRARRPDPVALGVSAPGPLDPWRGVVLSAPNLVGWNDVPLREVLGDRLGLPTFVERDTNVAVMAEWRYGAARGARTAIYVTVSTGIGGGVIADHRPLMGPDGTAGEIGHLVVELDGPPCGCGGIGHVEAIASGTALAREGARLVEEGRSPHLARLAAGAAPDAELVARAADAGDAACAALLERAWVAIGAMCGSLVNVFDPDVIVIGGSIAEHHPRLLDVARAELARRAFPILLDRVRIEPAALGGDVSLVGLVPILNDRFGDPAFAPGSQGPRLAAMQQGVGPS
jgi:glucokinase